jgi:RHS repeat-associated protein
LAQTNPLWYRSYYYDSETGYYHLKSRYYSPEVGRFLNADTAISNAGESIHGYNVFAYCFNNPVNLSDENGTWPSWAKKVAVAVAVVAVVAAVAAITVATAGTGTAAAVIAVGAAKGAAIGMISGAAIGAATGALRHRASKGSWRGAGKAALNGMGNGALSGAISGAIAGGISSGLCYNSGATSVGKGFDTFKQLKGEVGSPGQGNEWHHIVEQCQIIKSDFCPQIVQNTNNIVAISKTTHRAISGYYSSVQPFTNGMIVRNWLAGQSFSNQYEFGINVIKMFM